MVDKQSTSTKLRQLDYVKIADYESIFKHRKDKKGGGVVFFIIEKISFKTRNESTNNIVNMEVMFIELHGQNKSTPYLVAVAYYVVSINQLNYCG